MPDDKNVTKPTLPPEAERALKEAAERRQAQLDKEHALDAARAGEKGGPKEREPTRFGDWERGGRAYDF